MQTQMFIKNGELQLLNGGYLSDKTGNPVTNDVFYAAQKRAEYVITLLKEMEGKDFIGKKADSLEELSASVYKRLNEKEKTIFLASPEKVETPTMDLLKDEALAFLKAKERKGDISLINEFMQEFSVIKEYEEFGLFFTPGIVKLNKIYTVKDLVEAFSSPQVKNFIK